jgi:hypothetical protein
VLTPLSHPRHQITPNPTPPGTAASNSLTPIPHPCQRLFPPLSSPLSLPPSPTPAPHKDLAQSAPSVAIDHGSSAVRPEGPRRDPKDTGGHDRWLPHPHGSPKGTHPATHGPPRRRWGSHYPGYPGRSRDRGMTPSGHLQDHRKMLPGSKPEGGASREVTLSDEGERAGKAAASIGHEGASNQVRRR